MTTNFARLERNALADLFAQVGPDEPTLCDGWRTRDLAAHVVIRDRRPDAAAGIMIKALAQRTDRITRATATRDWATLIEQVRQPPRLSLAGFRPLDRATNTSEFFIHHEDVRRAQPGWSPRPLSEDHARALAGQIKMTAKFGLRRFPATITLKVPGYLDSIRTGAGGPDLELSGEPGEVALFLSGRQPHARVTIAGPDELVEKLRTTHLGV